MTAATATVDVLTAEVRTLMVGSRQVTLSVYKQLDHASWMDIEVFGRVRTSAAEHGWHELVGRGSDGALVRANMQALAGPAGLWFDECYDGPPWCVLNGARVGTEIGPRIGFRANLGPWSVDVPVQWQIPVAYSSVAADGIEWGEWRCAEGTEPLLRRAVAEAERRRQAHQDRIDVIAALPLIVLAGLR